MHSSSSQHIVVGLSGGVDSAVSAYLLQQQGYRVTALFMQNWHAAENDPHCRAELDLADARAVCDSLSIPLELVDFADVYWDKVFQQCLDDFARGITPNPDVLCNREIKFNVFLKHALDLGADKIATGHYVRSAQTEAGEWQLLKGRDPQKDQSYFLYMINQHALAHSLFPVGELPKTEVRRIAQAIDLPNHAKKDSTGICFIGERRFKDFLSEYLLAQPGPMKTDAGIEIGRHEGLMFYTLGQRKGLNIGGRQGAEENPWYVLDKDIKNNTLIVGQGHDHPLLYRNSLICTDMHWLAGKPPTTPLRCTCKTRYRQADQACTLQRLSAPPINLLDSQTGMPAQQQQQEWYEVKFEQAQRAITPGQAVVFYMEDVCLGGGTIFTKT